MDKKVINDCILVFVVVVECFIFPNISDKQTRDTSSSQVATYCELRTAVHVLTSYGGETSMILEQRINCTIMIVLEF